MQKLLNWKLAGIVILTLIFGFFSLPNVPQFQIGDNFSSEDIKTVLGLDLQGGTQLDYRIDLRKVPEEKQSEIIEGVIEVISRRVNALGVAEPNIYTSNIGGDQHIIVELAGVEDVEEARNRVGKTIQLEFKEERTELDPEFAATIQSEAQTFLEKVQNEKTNTFSQLAQAESLARPDSIEYSESKGVFRDEIESPEIAEAIFNAEPETIVNQVISGNNGYNFDINSGQLAEQEGLFVLKVNERKDVERESITQEKSVTTQHILIAYQNADRAADTVTRSKTDALALAETLITELNNGADFTTLVNENSDDPSKATNNGILDEPVTTSSSPYTEGYTDAALNLNEVNEYTTKPVETEFGYHIIKATALTPEVKETIAEPQVSYEQLFFSTEQDPWQTTGLSGEQFISANVDFDQFLQPVVNIQFNAEGAKLFKDITERNLNKPVAIFVGGTEISRPTVNTVIANGQATITGPGGLQAAEDLARELNTGAIPAPITLAGQYTIGSSLGQAALKTSITAGVIGLIILCIYMLAYYRLMGFLAVIALGIYALALAFIIKASLPVSIALAGGLAIGAASFAGILNSKESGGEKTISTLISLFALFFFTFLLREHVVLTLAGIAGLIMSIGIAVDANILIFERVREELKAGKTYHDAIRIGFDRAWSSIRDSNFSSLITCIILFYFGSSIIRGFALNLAAGILVSMFTAITITKSFLYLSARYADTRPSKLIMGVDENSKKEPKLEIIKYSRTWIAASLILVIISVGSLFFRGINLGIDFRGGTLMELQVADSTVDRDTLQTELNNIISGINEESLTDTTDQATEPETAAEISEIITTPVDTEIAEAEVINSTDEEGKASFIARFGYINDTTHDEILAKLQNRFGEITETRFTTIGAKVSDRLKEKALFAVVFALFVIVLYIAFAFRNVPKSVSPWKFGAAAIVALSHDVLITLGVFSLFQIEVDSLFITAILAVVGFSINDTIVVFDRLRENLKGFKASKAQFTSLANQALNQTLARSFNTSISTVFPLLALLIFGAQSIFHFVLALTIGILIGTYSSIFIATPVLVRWFKEVKTKK